jgi:hypothetical protein
MLIVDCSLWWIASSLMTSMADNMPANSLLYADWSEACPGVIALPVILIFDFMPSSIHADVPNLSEG